MASNNSVNTSLMGQTGTGNFVGSNGPTLITPNLGTPSAGNLVNCSGLSVIAANVTGLYPCDGRLTVTSGSPVSNSNGTKTTLFFSPYKGSNVSIYDSLLGWVITPFTETSVAIPSTTNTVYDVFIYINSGTVNTEAIAWSTQVARASAVAIYEGVYVLSSDHTKRYVGTFMTNGTSGNTQDDKSNRLVWNYYNRVPRGMWATDSTASWTYTSTALRQANGNTANQLNFVIGFPEDAVTGKVAAIFEGSTLPAVGGSNIGLNTTTSSSAAITATSNPAVAATGRYLNYVEYNTQPSFGYNFLTWLETGGSTVTWYGGSGAAGIIGQLMA